MHMNLSMKDDKLGRGRFCQLKYSPDISKCLRERTNAHFLGAAFRCFLPSKRCILNFWTQIASVWITLSIDA